MLSTYTKELLHLTSYEQLLGVQKDTTLHERHQNLI